MVPRYGMVIALNDKGEIVQSLQDPSGHYAFTSEVCLPGRVDWLMCGWFLLFFGGLVFYFVTSPHTTPIHHRTPPPSFRSLPSATAVCFLVHSFAGASLWSAPPIAACRRGRHDYERARTVYKTRNIYIRFLGSLLAIAIRVGGANVARRLTANALRGSVPAERLQKRVNKRVGGDGEDGVNAKQRCTAKSEQAQSTMMRRTPPGTGEAARSFSSLS